MLKKITIILIVFLFTFKAYSQFYVDAYYGINYSNKKYTLGYPFYNYTEQRYFGDPIDTTYYWNGTDSAMAIKYELISFKQKTENVNYNFYSGYSYGVKVGYVFLKYWVAETGINFRSKKTQENNKVTSLWKDEKYSNNELYFQYIQSNTLELNIYNFYLNLKAQYPIKKFTPCIFTGINFGKYIFYHNYESNDAFSEYNVVKKTQYWDKISLGAIFGIGVSYKIFKNTSIFANYSHYSFNLTPSKGKITENYSITPYNYAAPAHYIECEKGEIKENDIPVDNIHYSGSNFNIGIRYCFNKKQKATESPLDTSIMTN